MPARKLLTGALMGVMAVIPLAIGIRLLQLLMLASALDGVVVLPVWPNVFDAIILIISGVFWLVITFHRLLKDMKG
ncbi:MAG: hypothetical protein DRP01_02510 [Archaeoglobales archaeon]|nr:MAG: hypothetical protein DRP01_02510 [Archaeoglobales archaeon]